jgi:hypothetical protein
MRGIVFSLVAGVSLFVAGGAMAQTSPTPDLPGQTHYDADYQAGGPTDVKNAPNGDDTEVCNYQRETGSLLTTRVCRTLRAWKLMQSEAREFFEFQHLGAHQAGEHT